MSTALEPIALPQRIEFMRKIHLFYQVEEDQFDSIAPKLKESRYKPGEVIIRQGQEGDRFFMIHRGTVNVTRTNPKGEQSLAKLVTGDYFGEESLLTHHRRNATVTAIEETVLLSLSREDFSVTSKKDPPINSNFAVAVNSHRLARKMSFKWLRENEKGGEVIYFLARKHPILLRGLCYCR